MLEGYEARHAVIKNRESSGVTLYINTCITFKEVTNMSVVIDNIIVCITVESCTNR